MNRYDIDDPETWQAYVDEALDETSRARFEAAMADDPALAARVAAARRVRDRVRDDFAEVLDEPLPDRFAALLASPPAGNVHPLPVRARGPVRAGWALAIAASLAIVVVGLWWRTTTAPIRGEGAERFAGGALAEGLERRLSSEAGGDTVAIGLTFRDRDGHWCRSFAMPSETLAGLACRDEGRWRIVGLHLTQEAEQAEDWRQASSSTPPSILAEIDARIDGAPLDADEERSARDAGWR